MARTLVLTFETAGLALEPGNVIGGVGYYERGLSVASTGRTTDFPIRGTVIRTGTWDWYNGDRDQVEKKPYVYLRVMGAEHAIRIGDTGRAEKRIEP